MLIALISGRKSMKTTAAALLCHALLDRKPDAYEVIGYDTDTSSHFGSWALGPEVGDHPAPFPFEVVSAADQLFDRVTMRKHPHAGKVGIVDCGHMEDHVAITEAVLRAADATILVLEPTMNEVERLEKLRLVEIIKRVEKDRAEKGSLPLRRFVMMAKYNSRTNDVDDVAAYITDPTTKKKWDGWQVLETRIPYMADLSRIDTYNPPEPRMAKKAGFGSLITELETLGVLSR